VRSKACTRAMTRLRAITRTFTGTRGSSDVNILFRVHLRNLLVASLCIPMYAMSQRMALRGNEGTKERIPGIYPTREIDFTN
jgi:hypothetical protein